MLLDGSLDDVERPRDLPIRRAVDDHSQDGHLARGQPKSLRRVDEGPANAARLHDHRESCLCGRDHRRDAHEVAGFSLNDLGALLSILNEEYRVRDQRFARGFAARFGEDNLEALVEYRDVRGGTSFGNRVIHGSSLVQRGLNQKQTIYLSFSGWSDLAPRCYNRLATRRSPLKLPSERASFSTLVFDGFCSEAGFVISYRLDERIGARTQAGESAVSMRRARTRVVIVDADLRIIAADAGARELLGELEMREPSCLPRALEAALRVQGFGEQRQGDQLMTAIPGFVVRLLPLDEREGWSALLVERVCTRENLEAASRRFGLSRREIDVLRLLLEGDSASEIAQRLRIGECTVGDYVKRIFAKTRVRNRSEMIAKVLGWRPYAEEGVVS